MKLKMIMKESINWFKNYYVESPELVIRYVSFILLIILIVIYNLLK